MKIILISTIIYLVIHLYSLSLGLGVHIETNAILYEAGHAPENTKLSQ